MKAIFIFILSGWMASAVSAQSNLLKGRVTDAESGAPVSNAYVQARGTKGTVTDKNGEFSLSCDGSLVLVVSYIGYETYEERVSCSQELNIFLKGTSTSLDTIEISAPSNAGTSFLYQPASIGNVRQTEIKRGTGILMDDVININVPGVYMERRTFSAGQQFNIRGYGNGARGTNGINSNFDGQGYKVYLNGIPVTDAEGITLLDDIDFGSIGNVEIRKGPSGTLYGQAIAGVVNLKTIKPEPDNSSVGQDIMFGSYGLQRSTTNLQVSKSHSSFMVNYGKQKYDGFMPHTASEKDFVNFIGEFSPNEKQTLNTYVGYSNSYDQRNGEITREQWDGVDYTGNPNYIKNNAHSNVVSFRTGISHTYHFDRQISNTTSVFGTGLTNNASSAGGWTDKASANYGLRSTFDTRITINSRIMLSGVTGIELQRQNAYTLGYAMTADSFNLAGYNIIGALRSNQYTISKTTSAFTEWALFMPGGFSFTAGFGWSGLGIELNDRFYVAANNNPGNPNGTHKPSQFRNSFNNMFSPHLAINKVFDNRVSVYASFSSGYKAPVSSYFFIPLTGEVLTALKPEYATQVEAGTKGLLLNERINYQVAVFHTQYRDKMTTIAVPNETNTATSYVYVANAGEQNHTGIEFAMKGVAYRSDRWVSTITPFANITYSHFRYGAFKYQQLSSDKKSTVEVDFSDKEVAGVPPVVFNIGFDLATRPGIYTHMTYSYRDKMYYTSDNVNQTGKTQLLNTRIGFKHVYSRHIGLDAFVGLNNITQYQNYAMVFLNQLPDAYIPAPNEVNYYVGMNLSYIF